MHLQSSCYTRGSLFENYVSEHFFSQFLTLDDIIPVCTRKGIFATCIEWHLNWARIRPIALSLPSRFNFSATTGEQAQRRRASARLWRP